MNNYDNCIEKYPNGNLKLEINDGKGKQYYPSGKLEYEGEFKYKRFFGEGREFYENGNLKFEGTYDDIERTYGKYYYKEGHLKCEGKYENHTLKDGKIYMFANAVKRYGDGVGTGVPIQAMNDVDRTQETPTLKYSGKLYNGFFHGEGTLYEKGIEYKGIFHHGLFKIENENGVVLYQDILTKEIFNIEDDIAKSNYHDRYIMVIIDDEDILRIIPGSDDY